MLCCCAGPGRAGLYCAMCMHAHVSAGRWAGAQAGGQAGKYVCVCVSVVVLVWAGMCTYVCMHVWMCVCMHVCACMCLGKACLPCPGPCGPCALPSDLLGAICLVMLCNALFNALGVACHAMPWHGVSWVMPCHGMAMALLGMPWIGLRRQAGRRQ